MLNLTLIVFTLALSLVVAIVLYFYTTRTTLQVSFVVRVVHGKDLVIPAVDVLSFCREF